MKPVNVVFVIPGDRMDICVVMEKYCGIEHYAVQYEYSKKNDLWKYHLKTDNNRYFRTLALAKAAAKRLHSNNN